MKTSYRKYLRFSLWYWLPLAATGTSWDLNATRVPRRLLLFLHRFIFPLLSDVQIYSVMFYLFTTSVLIFLSLFLTWISFVIRFLTQLLEQLVWQTKSSELWQTKWKWKTISFATEEIDTGMAPLVYKLKHTWWNTYTVVVLNAMCVSAHSC